MTVRQNTASTGTPGADVTPENSGGGNDDAFFNTSFGGQLKYATVDGDLRFQADAQPYPSYMGWEGFTDGAPSVGLRFELKLESLPTNSLIYLVSIERVGPNFGVSGLKMSLNGSGQLGLWETEENQEHLFDFEAVTLSTGVWYRIEATFGLDTPGSFDVKVYPSPSSTEPILDEVAADWTWNHPGTFYSIHFGTNTYIPGPMRMWLDNLSVNDEGTLPGPVGAPSAPTSIDAPPADAYVDAPEPIVPVDIDIDAPPATGGVEAPVPIVHTAINVFVVVPDPATGYGQGIPPSLIAASLTLVSPVGNPALPTLRPTFQVAVGTYESGARVEVQYDTHPTFPHPITLTESIQSGMQTAYVSLTATESLSEATPWVWRARVVNDYDATAWSETAYFEISGPDGDALAGGHWNVSPTQAPTPHLWWTVPDRGRPGDDVVAIGTGFGPNTATISLSGVNAPGTLRTVEHSAVAYSEDRKISRSPDMVDCEHQRVDFIVPPVGPPAGPLFVDGS